MIVGFKQKDPDFNQTYGVPNCPKCLDFSPDLWFDDASFETKSNYIKVVVCC